jgi:hypothetical protein
MSLIATIDDPRVIRKILGHLGLPTETHPDHLLCYQLKRPSGAAKPAPVTPIFVNNQFGPEIVDATSPDELCVPSATTVP